MRQLQEQGSFLEDLALVEAPVPKVSSKYVGRYLLLNKIDARYLILNDTGTAIRGPTFTDRFIGIPEGTEGLRNI